MQGWIKEEGREYKDKWKGWKEGVDEKLDETMNGKKDEGLKMRLRMKAKKGIRNECTKGWMNETIKEKKFVLIYD